MSLQQVPAADLEVEILADGSFNAIVANASADVVEIADEDGFVAGDPEPARVEEQPTDVLPFNVDVELDPAVDTEHTNEDGLVCDGSDDSTRAYDASQSTHVGMADYEIVDASCAGLAVVDHEEVVDTDLSSPIFFLVVS